MEWIPRSECRKSIEKKQIDFGYNDRWQRFMPLVKLTWRTNPRTKKLIFRITLHHNKTWDPKEAERVVRCMNDAIRATHNFKNITFLY